MFFLEQEEDSEGFLVNNVKINFKKHITADIKHIGTFHNVSLNEVLDKLQDEGIEPHYKKYVDREVFYFNDNRTLKVVVDIVNYYFKNREGYSYDTNNIHPNALIERIERFPAFELSGKNVKDKYYKNHKNSKYF